MGTIRYFAAFFSLMLAVVAPWGCAGGSGEPETGELPIVLITVDGLFEEQLPELKNLPADGAAWLDCWTASPMSRPAVATYLTALAPDRHGVRDELFLALPKTTPTLATALSERGYRTAAFPGSSLLGHGSGLLRGFETVDDPPFTPIGPHKILPLARPAAWSVNNFKLWLAELPAGERYFAWLHFPSPMLDQLERATPGQIQLGKRAQGFKRKKARQGETEGEAAAEQTAYEENAGKPSALEEFDEAVGGILKALAERGELEKALVIVAPTMGDISGGATDAVGPGYSLEERAIRVPIIALFPKGSREPRDSASAVWAPDVPATIADIAGVGLHSEAEGLSLLEEPDDGRTIFSFSWATLDQMGWPALRAARARGVKLLEGYEEVALRLDGAERPIAEEDKEQLRQALLERADPAPFAVEFEEVRDWLAERGVEPRPVAASGRPFGPANERRQVTDYLWRSRLILDEKHAFRAMNLYRHILERDPDARAALMEQGQLVALSGSSEALPILKEAAKRYPTDPEVLHWLAHAVWTESHEDAEILLDTLLRYMPHDGDVLYDKACARSLSGDVDGAIEYLGAAIDAGYRRWEIIETDRDLRALRERPEFHELLGKQDR